MYKLALLFAIVASAQAQLVSNGTCDFSNLMRSRNDARAIATIAIDVLEIKRINNTWNTGHCTSVHMLLPADSTSASITVHEVVDEKLIERNTTISLTGPKSNYYNVVFNDFNSNFTILGAEDNFIILYACSNVGIQKQEYAWVLSTNTTLTEAEKNVTETVIKFNNLENATWVETSHSAEACKSGGISHVKLSPIILLVFGFLVSKGLK